MAGQWHGGKGSKARPFSVDQKTFDNNWDMIFKKDKVDGKEQSQQSNADQDGQATSGTIESNTAE